MTGAEVEKLCADFEAECEWVALWRRYPDVTEAQDEAMPACAGMSRLFQAFARERGHDASVVLGGDADDPEVWEHQWVRVGGLNIDWTARQFHNLADEPDLLDLPTPLMWLGSGEDHPVVRFRSTWLEA